MVERLVMALVLSCFAGPLAAQGPPPAELSAGDIAAVRETSARWLAAVQAGHWEDAAATYTNDAILWFPGATFEGKAAILKYLQAQKPFVGMNPHIDEIQGRGDMAFVSGYWTISVVGGAPVVQGRYLDIRLRQPDGTWLFYRDKVSHVQRPEGNSAMPPKPQ